MKKNAFVVMAKEATMSTWRKIGLAKVGVDDLGDGAREILLGSRRPEAGTPLILKPDLLDDLVAYLLELESPVHGSASFARFRNALLASALELETKGGEKVVMLAEPAERLVRERTSEFMAQDRSDLLALSAELGAAQTLSEDGAMLADASSTVASWSRAADAMESFLAAPRRACRFDLEDFFLSVNGINCLTVCIENLRRLLLAAGYALDTLGAATLGYHDFSGIDEAVAVWEMSQGSAARRLTKALAQLATRTQGLSGRVPDDALRPEPDDTSWIESCSRLGQDVLRWVYGRGQGALNFAAIVGVAWPGPALYGYDDEEAEPGKALELCAAFKGGRDANHPLVFGTYEATVSQDLVVPIPEEFLDEGAAERLFVTQSTEEPGALSCQTPFRRFARLAQLISSEQEFGGYPWDFIESGKSATSEDVPEDFASDFEEEFALCASGEEVAIEGGGFPLREVGTCSWAKPGTSVVLLGLGDHFEIADAGRHAAYEQQLGSDPSELLRAYFQD